MKCYCNNDDWPSFYFMTRPLSRKAHRCYECGGIIESGSRYERVFAKWDEAVVVKTCWSCLEMRDYLESRLECFCWEHGSLLDDMFEVAREVAHEVPGLGMGFGRMYIDAIKRRSQGE